MKCSRCSRSVDKRSDGKPYKLCEMHRASMRVADARRRRTRIDAGTCTQCPNPVSVKYDDTLYKLCDIHRTQSKLRNRAARARCKEMPPTFIEAVREHMLEKHGYDGLPFIPSRS